MTIQPHPVRSTLQRMRSPGVLFALSLVGVSLLSFFGPPERSLGTNIRVVYLHGAWVWTALIALIGAGLVGTIGLVRRSDDLHHWSQALGRTGLFFWISYLPLSVWAMQTNWNGLYLAEPRWRVAVVFAIAGLLIQVGAALMDRPAWTSALNGLFIGVLLLALNSVDQVMHPESPVFESEAVSFRVFFLGLTALVLVSGWQLTRWWHQLTPSPSRSP